MTACPWHMAAGTGRDCGAIASPWDCSRSFLWSSPVEMPSTLGLRISALSKESGAHRRWFAD